MNGAVNELLCRYVESVNGGVHELLCRNIGVKVYRCVGVLGMGNVAELLS